jgi:hypothetical protein
MQPVRYKTEVNLDLPCGVCVCCVVLSISPRPFPLESAVCYQTPIKRNNYRGTARCNFNQVQDSTP